MNSVTAQIYDSGFVSSSSRSIGVDWRELAVEADPDKPQPQVRCVTMTSFTGMQRPIHQPCPKPFFFHRMRANRSDILWLASRSAVLQSSPVVGLLSLAQFTWLSRDKFRRGK